MRRPSERRAAPLLRQAPAVARVYAVARIIDGYPRMLFSTVSPLRVEPLLREHVASHEDGRRPADRERWIEGACLRIGRALTSGEAGEFSLAPGFDTAILYVLDPDEGA